MAMATEIQDRSIEQIALSALRGQSRVTAFMAPDRYSGVSMMSEMVARVFANWGHKTLLIELSQSGEDSIERLTNSARHGLKPQIVHHRAGYDYLDTQMMSQAQQTFAKFEQFRRLLTDELADYSAIILDIPAVMAPRSDRINPVAIAAASDMLFLLCVKGRTTNQRVMHTIELTRTAGINVAGMVVNEFDYAAKTSKFL
jgi:hypothetical protein